MAEKTFTVVLSKEELDAAERAVQALDEKFSSKGMERQRSTLKSLLEKLRDASES